MGIVRLHSQFARVFTQRCFYLFVSLIALIAVAPFAAETFNGRLVLVAVQVLVLVAAVAAVGRTTLPFVIALLLGVPAFLLQFASALGFDWIPRALILANIFFVAFHVVAVVYLLRYVFSEDVMSSDKLFGAAAAFIMLGVTWAYAYNLVQHFDPGAFGALPGQAPRSLHDLLYMSFGLLTSNGPGDIALVGTRARTLSMLEQITGTLFVAILIARLAGIYPPGKKEGPDA